MSLELSMVGLVVKNMPASLEFYRRLGVEIPAAADDERFVMHRMESGVTLFWDTVLPEVDPRVKSRPVVPGCSSSFWPTTRRWTPSTRSWSVTDTTAAMLRSRPRGLMPRWSMTLTGT